MHIKANDLYKNIKNESYIKTQCVFFLDYISVAWQQFFHKLTEKPPPKTVYFNIIHVGGKVHRWFIKGICNPGKRADDSQWEYRIIRFVH